MRCFLEESVLGIRSRHLEQIDLKADHNTSTGVSDEKFVKNSEECYLQLHSDSFGLKQLSTTIKTFITTALEYKAILKLLKQFVRVAMHFLVMSLFT